ncbi:hypothetical protein [Salinimicrobium marinum]|uniref:hypothetical protein n=1 Tax=Salinimicrobium marinum TaxID=680283 RepID=UPI001674B940|nr:hypothetical protein [Salinimicrobium marinum]
MISFDISKKNTENHTINSVFCPFAIRFVGVAGSLYLPIGLHFGWNLVTITIFSQGPSGDQLLISSTENTLGGW